MSRASSAQIDFVAKDDKFTKIAARVEKTMGRVQAKMKQVSVAARRVFLVGSGAIAAVGAAFGSFEQRMARVSALTSATSAQMVELKDAAREMGKATVFSANQAADAMAFFAQAGFGVQKIMAALGPTLNLAAAGQLEIARAADLVTNIMTGMGIESDKLGIAVDVLTKTFTSSNTSLEQLADAFKFVGPVAASAGVNLNQAAAAIAALSDAGLQATLAGTGLRQVLLLLQTSRVEDAMNEFGVAIRDAKFNMLGFPSIIDNMNRAMQRMNPKEQAELMGLFGARAGPALRVLLREGGDGLRDFEKMLLNAGGTAKEIADTQIDTLFGSLKILQSAAAEAGIALGEALVGHLRGLVDFTKNAVAAFNELDKKTVTLTANLLLLGTGIAGVTFLAAGSLASLAAMTIAAKALAVSLGAAAVASLAFLATPVGLVLVAFAAGIAAAGTAFAALRIKIAQLSADMAQLTEESQKTGQVFQEMAKLRKTIDSKDSSTDDRLEASRSMLANLKLQLKEFEKQKESLESSGTAFGRLTGIDADNSSALETQVASIRKLAEQIEAQESAIESLAEQSKKEAFFKGVNDRADQLAIRRTKLMTEAREAQAKATRSAAAAEKLLLDARQAERDARLKEMRTAAHGRKQGRLDAEKDARRREIAIREQIAIKTGKATQDQFDLQDLRRSGASAATLSRVEAAMRDLRGNQGASQPRVMTGSLEGLRDTRKRIQEASLGREDRVLSTARQNLTQNSKAVTVLEAMKEALDELVAKNIAAGFS